MGCHKLIYDGAGIAYTPEILLRELGIDCENNVKSKTKNDLGLATDLKLVYSCLDLRPKSMDFLIQKTGLPPEKIGSLLLELKLSGLAREIGRHYYVKKPRTDTAYGVTVYCNPGKFSRSRRDSMAKYLVIVESPAKVKTIKKFLGSNYDVQASNGHVRDFPKSQFGIDVENDFEPKYITITWKGRIACQSP